MGNFSHLIWLELREKYPNGSTLHRIQHLLRTRVIKIPKPALGYQANPEA